MSNKTQLETPDYSVRQTLTYLCVSREFTLKQRIEQIEAILGTTHSPIPDSWRCEQELNGKMERIELNCHAVALGFSESELYLSTFRESPKDFSVDSKYVADLINKEILKPATCFQNDSLVIYFDEMGQVKHSGILLDNVKFIVLSKWGWDGLPRFYHLIDLVPGKAPPTIVWLNGDPNCYSYGTEVKCYERPNLIKIENHFQNYFQKG